MSSKFPKKFKDVYTLGDCYEVLKKLPDNCVDLCFTGVPDCPKEWTPETYHSFLKKVVKEVARVVKPEGFIALAQQDRRYKGIILPKHIWFYTLMTGLGLHLKDEKIIVKDRIDRISLFQFNYQYYSLYTVNGVFRKRKGDALKDIIIDKQQQFNRQKTWSIKLCKMVIRATTDKGGIVIDPFAGIAPVLFSAQETKRHFWGAELDPVHYNKNFKLFWRYKKHEF